MIPDKGQLTADVKAWAGDAVKALKDEFKVLDIVHRVKPPYQYGQASVDALKAAVSTSQGTPRRISFKFPRHMVFVAKGVGKGVPISMVGKKGTRRPKDWFDGPMDRNIGKLADKLADDYADLYVRGMKLN